MHFYGVHTFTELFHIFTDCYESQTCPPGAEGAPGDAGADGYLSFNWYIPTKLKPIFFKAYLVKKVSLEPKEPLVASTANWNRFLTNVVRARQDLQVPRVLLDLLDLRLTRSRFCQLASTLFVNRHQIFQGQKGPKPANGSAGTTN